MTIESSLSRMTPATIASVPDGVQRPLWSVMIPTFNCTKYLPQTLNSVLAQDPGPEHMQIEVVDDCSTKDDPEAVVKELGKGRVDFYRKNLNEGAIQNFNTCIQRSRGHLVHILHGDDWVLPGFYDTMAQQAKDLPHCSGFFCRSFVVSESGELESLFHRLDSLETPGSSPTQMFYRNHILTPSAVVRREFYETHGGYRTGLPHVADWDMWVRVINTGTGLFINKPLAAYRYFPGNDSGRLARTAEHLRDYLRLANILQSQFSDFDRSRFDASVAEMAIQLADHFRRLGDDEAASHNENLAKELRPPVVSMSLRARLRRTISGAYRDLLSKF